jgi:SAM-dependent methyltransferase
LKVFDSAMPEEAYWSSLFDVPAIIDWLDLESVTDPIVEIGCGYGTFSVPVARRTSQTVHAIDIEPSMIAAAGARVREAGVRNVVFHCRDVLDTGTGLASGSTGLVLLFNILHSPERAQMLKEASAVLKKSGKVAIIHWRKDIPTPRGPSVASRPDLLTIIDAIAGLDLHVHGESRILEPYHWGVQLIKEAT